MRMPTPDETAEIRRVCQRMREVREAAGISRMQAAVALGVDFSTVGRLERGEARNGPPLAVIVAWARLCGVTLAQLVAE